MKRVIPCLALLLSSAAALPAMAEITLSGNARLGLGYNIDNEGTPMRPSEDDVSSKDNKTRTIQKEETVDVRSVDPETGEVTFTQQTRQVDEDVVTQIGTTDDLRAVSRIRFIFTATGETESGIAFGASIRADNADKGGTSGSAVTGQTGGDVFVSGAWGTLTFGDTDGADYARVGDPIGNVSLTGLGDWNELPFVSNGGGADNDELQFVTDPAARPTVRYDYDYEGFGFSLSTDRELNAVGVGGGYTHEFDKGEISIGLGYYDWTEFDGELSYYGEVTVPDGDEWSASLKGEYDNFQAGIGYASIDAGWVGQLDVLNVGLGATFGAWTAMAYYSAVVSGDELFGDAMDGENSYGASLAYDLGGGAQVQMGLVRSYGADAIGKPGDDQYAPALEAATIADFGISMKF